MVDLDLKAHFLVKELYEGMPKCLQPNTTDQWKLRNKTAVEVSNHSKARLEFFRGMAIEFVLSQVFSTTLLEKVLQIVIWVEEVTIWQELAYLSSLCRISN